MRIPSISVVATLCGTLLAGGALAADERRPVDAAPAYGDSADIPASDPAVRRPQSVEEDSVNVRQEPSGPDIGPGAERDSLVPLPEDNDGRIDPQ